MKPLQAYLGLALTLTPTLACTIEPPRYGGGPICRKIEDRRASPRPPKRRNLGALFSAEAFVNDHLVEDLRATPAPRARDVNRFDDVFVSSWYRGPRRSTRPPAPDSWRPSTEESRFDIESAHVVEAGRRRFDLIVDDEWGWRTAAAMVSVSMAEQLGFWVPPTYLVHAGDLRIVLVERQGDVGATPAVGTRDGDPNDVIDHGDRRILRVHGLYAWFVGSTSYGEHNLRDRYLGENPTGHLVHEVLPLPDALGLGEYLRRLEPDETDANFGERLITFGFATRAEAAAPPRDRAHRLELLFRKQMGDLGPDHPPGERLRRDDAYWFARRLMATSIRRAVEAAELSPTKAKDLEAVLTARRKSMVERICRDVSPLQLSHFHHDEKGGTAWLEDMWLTWNLPNVEGGTYEVTTLAGDVEALSLESWRGRIRLRWRGPVSTYSVLAIRRCTASRCAPPAQLHLAPNGSFRAFIH